MKKIFLILSVLISVMCCGQSKTYIRGDSIFLLNNATSNTHVTIQGTFRLNDGTQVSGYVLTTDANGNATWQPSSGGGGGTPSLPNRSVQINGDGSFYGTDSVTKTATGLNLIGPLTLVAALDNQYEITNRGVNLGFPVGVVRPVESNKVIAFDIMPNGSPTQDPSNGKAWLDIVDTDVKGNENPVGAARVGITNTVIQFGSKAFNGATLKPVNFILGSDVILALNTDLSATWNINHITQSTAGSITYHEIYNTNLSGDAQSLFILGGQLSTNKLGFMRYNNAGVPVGSEVYRNPNQVELFANTGAVGGLSLGSLDGAGEMPVKIWSDKVLRWKFGDSTLSYFRVFYSGVPHGLLTGHSLVDRDLVDSLISAIPVTSSLFPTTGTGTATGDVIGDLNGHGLLITNTDAGITTTVNLTPDSWTTSSDDGLHKASISHGTETTVLYAALSDETVENSLEVNATQGILATLGIGKTFEYAADYYANYTNRSFIDFGSTKDAVFSFTNKTITSSTNTLGGVTMGLGSDATGDIYYRNSGGVLTRLPIGTTRQKLSVVGGLPAWIDSTASGGGGGAAGSTTQIQYNNSGSFAASSNLTYDEAVSSRPRLSVTGDSPSIEINYSASSTLGELKFVGPSSIAGGFLFTSDYNGLFYLGGWGTAAPLLRFLQSTNSLGINTPSGPVASAKLEIASTTQGFLPPRMTTTQQNAISSPAEGLHIYDNVLHRPGVYNGSAWKNLAYTSDVGVIKASADLTGQTATTNITSYANGASDGSFTISAYVDITAISAGILTVTATYTDINSNSRTATFYGMGTTTAGLGALGSSNFAVLGELRVKASTTITVIATLTVGTATFDASATITQLR